MLEPIRRASYPCPGRVSAEIPGNHDYPLVFELFDNTIPIKLRCVLYFRYVWSGLVFLQHRYEPLTTQARHQKEVIPL